MEQQWALSQSEPSVKSDQSSMDNAGGGSKGKKSQRPFQRKRARRACMACHERKVRCDVLLRQPCTNCEQDRCRCIVRPHKNRRPSVAAYELSNQQDDASGIEEYEGAAALTSMQSQQQQFPVQMTASVTNPEMHRPPHMAGEFQQQAPGSGQGFYPPDPSQFFRQNMDGWGAQANLTLPVFNQFDHYMNYGQPMQFGYDTFMDTDPSALTGLEGVFNTAPIPVPDTKQYQPTPQLSPPTSSHTGDTPKSPLSSFMDLSSSPAVIESLRKKADRVGDVDFLRSEGCFQIPTAPDFYLIMQAFFMFVHPNLPIINEAEFWALWSPTGPKGEESFHLGHFSMLVVQAMAFAATSFTPAAVIERCGFRGSRQARITFHRRAKLLFEYEMESDPVLMAQSCLLLTYFASDTSSSQTNTWWLSNAIYYARQAHADRFYEIHPHHNPRRTALKRLWWGCCIRDRVLPLGMHRPIQIRDNLAFGDDSRFLTESDFEDEIGASRVHHPDTQRHMLHIINLMCRLCEALTPVLRTVLPPEKPRDRARTTPDTFQPLMRDIKAHFDRLHGWYECATLSFPSPVSLGEEEDTVVICANLMFIYYDAAVLALSHLKMMAMQTRAADTPKIATPYESPILPEIVAAVSDTTERMKELMQLRLAKHLPISISAYLTLPLLLHALSVKAATTPAEDALARRQLSIYMRAMKFQQEVYDGTDFVFRIIDNVERYIDHEQAASLLESDSSSETASAGTREGGSTSGGASSAGHGGNAGSTFINTRPSHFHSGTKPSAESSATHSLNSTPSHSNHPNPHHPSNIDGSHTTHRRHTGTPLSSSTTTKSKTHPSSSSSSKAALRQPFAWQALLLRKPKLYLRLVLHVDVAFCEGRRPEEVDFPGALRRIV